MSIILQEIIDQDADDTGILKHSTITARGDIIIGDASSKPVRLAIGVNNQILKSDGTDISWQDNDAISTTYDSTTSGLGASNVQEAIDTLDSRVDTAETDITNIEAKTDFITVTQPVDLDTIESDTALNNAHRETVTGNPHAVTKTEVGLGNVPDVDTTNASNISSGTLADARLSSNVNLLDTNQTVTGSKTMELMQFAKGTVINNNASSTLAEPNKTTISLTGVPTVTDIVTITDTTIPAERMIVLRNDTAAIFTLKTTGNIAIAEDVELIPEGALLLQYNGVDWAIVGGAGGAGGGAYELVDITANTNLTEPLYENTIFRLDNGSTQRILTLTANTTFVNCKFIKAISNSGGVTFSGNFNCVFEACDILLQGSSSLNFNLNEATSELRFRQSTVNAGNMNMTCNYFNPVCADITIKAALTANVDNFAIEACTLNVGNILNNTNTGSSLFSFYDGSAVNVTEFRDNANAVTFNISNAKVYVGIADFTSSVSYFRVNGGSFLEVNRLENNTGLVADLVRNDITGNLGRTYIGLVTGANDTQLDDQLGNLITTIPTGSNNIHYLGNVNLNESSLVAYDNTLSGLMADNVQDAIDEVVDTKQDDVITTRGDIIVGDASNVASRLPIGAVGRVLTSDGTDVSWQNPSPARSLITITSSSYALSGDYKNTVFYLDKIGNITLNLNSTVTFTNCVFHSTYEFSKIIFTDNGNGYALHFDGCDANFSGGLDITVTSSTIKRTNLKVSGAFYTDMGIVTNECYFYILNYDYIAGHILNNTTATIGTFYKNVNTVSGGDFTVNNSEISISTLDNSNVNFVGMGVRSNRSTVTVNKLIGSEAVTVYAQDNSIVNVGAISGSGGFTLFLDGTAGDESSVKIGYYNKSSASVIETGGFSTIDTLQPGTKTVEYIASEKVYHSPYTTSVVSSSKTAAKGGEYITSGAAGITITCPAPVLGLRFRVIDGGGNWSTNNVTIAPNGGEQIDFSAGNFVLDVDKAWVELVSDGTNWLVLKP